MRDAERQSLIKHIAIVIREYYAANFTASVGPLADRVAAHGATIAELQVSNAELQATNAAQAARLAAFEAKAYLWDAGVWCPGVYERGAQVTYQGTTWIAQATTSAQPGHDHSWRLFVKNRDAR